MSFDTISNRWTDPNRIGNITPHYSKETFLDIEKKVREMSLFANLECKYNVGAQIGGIPPIDDEGDITDSKVHAIKYHDVMGGMLISSRNAELNCRNVQSIIYSQEIDEELVSTVASNINDKYELASNSQHYNNVIMIPGSNLFHTVEWQRVTEILIDFPDAVIKPHPVTTDETYLQLTEEYAGKVLDMYSSGMQLNNTAEMVWTTYNSEMGLIRALNKKPFGTLSKWENTFILVYSPIYRVLKYKDVQHNYECIAKLISCPYSGWVFPWQNDWEERVENYFEQIQRFEKGMKYPYRGNWI